MNPRSGILTLLLLSVWLGPVEPVCGQDSSADDAPSRDSSIQDPRTRDAQAQDAPAQDSPAQIAAVAMVETILSGDDGEPVWDALTSALGDRSPEMTPVEMTPVGVTPGGASSVGASPMGIGSATRYRERVAARLRDFASSVRASSLTAETLTFAGVLALLSIAAMAVLFGTIRKARPETASAGSGATAGRFGGFRRGGGRSRSGPVCRDAARLEARLRTRRSA
jgi:hypothetical protein